MEGCFTPFVDRGKDPMKILVTRPLADGQEIAARLAEKGHQTLLAPLLEPRFFDGPALELGGVQAILATSANGIRALVRRTERRDVPVFAVGPQTADEAKRAGFADVRCADGDAVALAEAATHWAERGDVLLHVCGEDAPGTLSDSLRGRGFAVRCAVLYRMEAAAVPAARGARRALEKIEIDAVMFFSPRSAQLFLALGARPINRPAHGSLHQSKHRQNASTRRSLRRCAWRQSPARPECSNW